MISHVSFAEVVLTRAINVVTDDVQLTGPRIMCEWYKTCTIFIMSRQ